MNREIFKKTIPDYVLVIGIAIIMAFVLAVAWKVDEDTGSCGAGLDKEINVCVAKSEYVRLKVLESRYQNE